MKHRAHVLSATILVLIFASPAVAQSPTEIEELRLAAEQGDPDAQAFLGVRHDLGNGVPQDYVQAHKWINLAASRTTTEKAGDYRLARDEVAEKMTASQVAEAQRLAREWQQKTWEQLKANPFRW